MSLNTWDKEQRQNSPADFGLGLWLSFCFHLFNFRLHPLFCTINVDFIIFTLLLNDRNNFMKWLPRKVFVIIKVHNATNIAVHFSLLYENWFFLAHFYFKCNLKNPEWILQSKTRVNNYYKRFSLRIANKSCNEGLKFL